MRRSVAASMTGSRAPPRARCAGRRASGAWSGGGIGGRCSTKTMDGAENRVQVKWDKGGSHNWQPGTHFDIVGSVEADYRVPDSPKKGAAAEA